VSPVAGTALDASDLARYARHLVLPEVGAAGQERLRDARVLVVGVGGLGSPAALYLAAAGVGTLGLVDFDTIEESNLQRQVLFAQPDVGRPKLEVACERLQAANPKLALEPHAVRLDRHNALDVVCRYDIVLDGSDNLPTRYLVNDACVLSGRPDVYGSIFRFEGQLSVFWGGHGPCYRCLFPEPPPPALVPSCAEGGVLGVLPGVVGALQASEAIKWIVGAGELAVGRLVLFDALGLRFRELRLRRDPGCPVCGERPTVRELVDYDGFCGVPPPGAEPGGAGPYEITPRELAAWRAASRPLVLVDVRTSEEWAFGVLDGALRLPLHELPRRMNELDPGAEIVVYCHLGVRSLHAVQWLRAAGFARSWSLRGGTEAWSLEIDPALARY
jgi:adenylyltransferase/sulfurtransferase